MIYIGYVFCMRGELEYMLTYLKYIIQLLFSGHKQTVFISVIPSKDLHNHPVPHYIPSHSLHSASGPCSIFVAHGMFWIFHFSSKTLLS